MVYSYDLYHNKISWLCGTIVSMLALCARGRGFESRSGHSLSRLSIACDIKLEGALYSVFYAEASKRPHTWELGVPCVDSLP